MENQMKPSYPCLSVVLGFVCSLFLLAQAPRCAAQADPTAFKTSDISAFGGYENIDPAYGPDRNNGEGFGLNFTRYFPRLRVDPSIEARVNLTNGTDVKERTYLLGLQAKKTYFTHYHPYVDFLAGTGTIHFNTRASGYVGDNSIIYNFGGGVDIDLVHNFELRVDYQHQLWSLGQETNSFAPNLFLFGVNYTIPFRDYKNQHDLNP
jgi:opacity protein-like surface antigen